ncbi:unnamed protein product [Meloidogyne enterolobii]|uniref:Uncharacterized protein n=1 Tax=Meloidogyne enterolobii TaxID=390850 RepID=A0ACB0XZ53_MELEN
MTRKKSNKTASNNHNSDRPTKNISKNNNNTIEAAFKRIQNIRQCPKCNKKMDYSIYLQHYEKCKNREVEEDDDDDIIFCGEGQGHKENEQGSREASESKKNLKRTQKSSVVVNVEEEDSQSNAKSPRSSALNSGIVSENVFDGNVRRGFLFFIFCF